MFKNVDFKANMVIVEFAFSYFKMDDFKKKLLKLRGQVA